MNQSVTTLDPTNLHAAIQHLAQRDADLATVITRIGPPPLWERETGFATLIYIILEQQVSLASAKAAFNRLLAAADPLVPTNFLQLSDDELRIIGFSRQKTRYCRILAQAVLDGQLDIDAFEQQSDQQVYSALTSLTGIGAWTANIYLLMALRRPDIWPAGDLALQVAAQQVKRLPTRPTVNQLEALAEPWRPYRAVAARILWHHYLSK